MSKLILCFVLLFNIYICEEIKQVRTFGVKDAGKELNIRLGEEFAIKMPRSITFSRSFNFNFNFWGLSNEEETKEFLPLLRKIYQESTFYFKAIKVTNGPIFLQLSKSSITKKNIKSYTFRINVK